MDEKRIHDSRALMGAVAMVIIGAILSLMVAFYMLPEVFGEKALVARWWWEIVLNLQILSLALMWFCHHNRILQSSGWWRLRAIAHFGTGVVSVLYPVGILLISAWMDWFRTPPPPVQVYTIMVGGIALWAFGSFIMPIITWLMVRRERDAKEAKPLGLHVLAWIWAFWPTFAAILAASCGWVREGVGEYALVPILLYTQGALPYFRKARHASPRDSDI